ncbi:MAG: hypothetical protein IPK80_29800 [Nannocystis sp.]|nr:hypothetical protein [Nannocystis sp.]
MSKQIDWYYHRTSCTTCARAQDHLTAERAQIAETTSANKVRFERDQALELARRAERVVIARGAKLIELDPKATDADQLAALLLGPSGKLRAPALRVGPVLYVGFTPAMYSAALA